MIKYHIAKIVRCCHPLTEGEPYCPITTTRHCKSDPPCGICKENNNPCPDPKIDVAIEHEGKQ